MSRHFARYLRLRDNAKNSYRDIFSAARHHGLPHAVMLERRGVILDNLNQAKAPHWVKAYLEGYWECLQSKAYESDLVFGGMVGDVFYSTHSDRPDYYEKHGIAPSDYADDGRVQRRGHYWRESLKPFFVDTDRTRG